MKFIQRNGSFEEEVEVKWGDHYPACEHCREVAIEKSATFVRACALGAKLLMEELTKRAAPAVKAKAEEVRAEAEKAGVFKMGHSKEVHTKYVGEGDGS